MGSLHGLFPQIISIPVATQTSATTVTTALFTAPYPCEVVGATWQSNTAVASSSSNHVAFAIKKVAKNPDTGAAVAAVDVATGGGASSTAVVAKMGYNLTLTTVLADRKLAAGDVLQAVSVVTGTAQTSYVSAQVQIVRGEAT